MSALKVRGPSAVATIALKLFAKSLFDAGWFVVYVQVFSEVASWGLPSVGTVKVREAPEANDRLLTLPLSKPKIPVLNVVGTVWEAHVTTGPIEADSVGGIQRIEGKSNRGGGCYLVYTTIC